MEQVDIIASGYEWFCPSCDCFHEQAHWTEQVICKKCSETFETALPEHAF